MAESRVLEILKQVESGDLTPEEADRVLARLGGAEPPEDGELDHPHHAAHVPPAHAWSLRGERGMERARARLERHRARLERRLRHEHARRERLHHRLGDSYSVDHLIRLRLHGISQDYIEEMREAGYDGLKPEELVELRIHGVSPDYVADMREQLGDVPVDKMIEFRIHGVSPDLVEELRESGVEDPSPDDVLRWRHTARGSRFGGAVSQAVDVVGPHISQLVESALAEARQRIYEALKVSPEPPEAWSHVDTRPAPPAEEEVKPVRPAKKKGE